MEMIIMIAKWKLKLKNWISCVIKAKTNMRGGFSVGCGVSRRYFKKYLYNLEKLRAVKLILKKKQFTLYLDQSLDSLRHFHVYTSRSACS